jgi:hypothetical protein
MKLIAFCMFMLSTLGQEITDLGVMTDPVRPVSNSVGLSINHCHPGDRAVIHVIPIPENDVRLGGWFSTTNDVLKMDELSMLPSGLNRLEVWPVCRGLTGEVSHVVIDLQRPPPAIKFGTVRVNKPASTNSPVPLRMAAKTAREWPPMPPLPPGMAGMMPLPDAETNRVSYKDSQLMKVYFSRQRRQ